ncbi:hypothetical protein A9Z42_0043760 [Trichoderma parareesei]|uniref:Uncharacterized protein n=1 Tax=Trichoderma parareesei TaxID=858221 RepID=A0A2H2Z977_TRIPA|nr:hypothetical protein A9Z42_0043760 [Trichoderma parareesei]
MSEVQAERDDDEGNGNGNGDDSDVRDHVNDDEMTMSDSSDGKTVDSNMSYHNNAVTWNDDSSQKQRADGVHLDIFFDTLSNTCLFKLYCSVLHKGSKAKGQKHTLFLFIHPESVREITLNNGRSSGPSTSKPSRPICANLGSLYAGRGGEIVILDKVIGGLPDDTDAPPPSYAGPSQGEASKNKRRRIDPPVDKGKSPAVSNDLFNFIRSSFDSMETRICARIDDVAGQFKTQLDDLGTRLDGIESRLQQLEDTVSDAVDVDHSASIQEEVSDQLDDCIIGIKAETEDVFKSIDDRFDETMERLEQEVSERLDRLEEDVKDCTVEIVESSLKRKLTNASLRVDGSVFLDF